MEPKLYRDPKRDFVTNSPVIGSLLNFINVIDKPFWITKDGRMMYPEQDMDASHIENVMRLLKGKTFIDNHREARNLFYVAVPYPSGEMAQDAFDHEQLQVLHTYEMTHEQYFEEFIKPSTLWQCLERGKAKHERKLLKVQNINKGVIDW